MKIDIRMEKGAPIIFYPDDVNRDGSIVCVTQAEGHCTAQRASMHRLLKPQTAREIRAAWQFLARMANQYAKG